MSGCAWEPNSSTKKCHIRVTWAPFQVGRWDHLGNPPENAKTRIFTHSPTRFPNKVPPFLHLHEMQKQTNMSCQAHDPKTHPNAWNDVPTFARHETLQSSSKDKAQANKTHSVLWLRMGAGVKHNGGHLWVTWAPWASFLEGHPRPARASLFHVSSSLLPPRSQWR